MLPGYDQRMSERGTDSRPGPQGRDHRAYRRLKARERRRWERATQPPLCWRCGLEIDMSARHPDPGTFTLDHVVPLARGGDLVDPLNVAPCHLSCNSSRGDGRQRRMSKRQQSYQDKPATAVDW